jgi:hypothetical protein
MAHVNLANLLLRSEELARAREIALRLDADHPQAHQGLGNLLANSITARAFKGNSLPRCRTVARGRQSRYCFSYRLVAATFRPLRFWIIGSSFLCLCGRVL